MTTRLRIASLVLVMGVLMNVGAVDYYVIATTTATHPTTTSTTRAGAR